MKQKSLQILRSRNAHTRERGGSIEPGFISNIHKYSAVKLLLPFLFASFTKQTVDCFFTPVVNSKFKYCMKQQFFILALFIVLLNKTAVGQTHNHDTIVNGKFYSFISYYDNGKIMALGSYNDTLKSGDWIYFTRNGAKIAFGIYQDDSKFGTWTYYNRYNKKEPLKIKWTEKNKPSEKFEFDKKGNLILIDIVYSSPCFHTYRNGILTMTARAL